MKKTVTRLRYSLLLITGLIMLPFSSRAQVNGFVWAKQISPIPSANYTTIIPKKIAPDQFGHIYNTGFFAGTVDFDPSSNVQTLTSVGPDMNAYLAKYDTLGNLKWVKSFPADTSFAEYPFSSGEQVKTDLSGNIYLSGFFWEWMDADPGPGVFPLTNNLAYTYATYIIKLDSSGVLQWAKALTGNNNLMGMDLDIAGNICITGTYNDTVDFDPGPGIFPLISVNGGTIFSPPDMFVLKLDNAGEFMWAKSIHGFGSETPGSIVTGASDNAVYITGYYSEDPIYPPDFNPDENVVFNFPAAPGALFCLKLDALGNFTWCRNVSAAGLSIQGRDLALDEEENIYIIGNYAANQFLQVDFDPGNDTFYLPSMGGVAEIFILKLQTSGDFLWAKKVSSAQGFDDLSIVAGSDKVFAGGYFRTPANYPTDFDPGNGEYKLGCNGAEDAFQFCLNSSGNFVWAASYGASGQESLRGLAVHEGALYSSGYFSQTVDFDPGLDTYNLTTAIGLEGYLHKIRVCQSFTNLKEVACDSFVFNGISYMQSGTYRDTFTNTAGCDSIVKLDLTIQGISHYTLHTDTACDSYTFLGETYTQSGYYADTFLNATGCDSIIALQLTLGQSSENNVSLTACDAYTLGDSTYNLSGIYTQIFTTVNGCDSTVHLDLTIAPSPIASVVPSGNILIAGAAEAYQWVDCDHEYAAVAGANGQSFAPQQLGSYAVVINTAAGCSDTSGCYTAGSTGIQELGPGNVIQFYPNPTTGILMIELKNAIPEGQFQITDVTGRVWYTRKHMNGRMFRVDMEAYTAGVYFVTLQSGLNIARSAITKQK